MVSPKRTWIYGGNFLLSADLAREKVAGLTIVCSKQKSIAVSEELRNQVHRVRALVRAPAGHDLNSFVGEQISNSDDNIRLYVHRY